MTIACESISSNLEYKLIWILNAIFQWVGDANLTMSQGAGATISAVLHEISLTITDTNEIMAESLPGTLFLSNDATLM